MEDRKTGEGASFRSRPREPDDWPYLGLVDTQRERENAHGGPRDEKEAKELHGRAEG